MGLFVRSNMSKFLYLTRKDFKKNLMEKEKEEFKRLLALPECRAYLDVLKRLDKDLKREGKKTIPAVDLSAEIMRRCGIEMPSKN